MFSIVKASQLGKAFSTYAYCILAVAGGCTPAPERPIDIIDQFSLEHSATAGDLIERNYLLKNRSDSPLEIVSVLRSCGCQYAELEDDHLPPHGTSQLTVRMRVSFADSEETKPILLKYYDGRKEFAESIDVPVGQVHRPFLSVQEVDFGLVDQSLSNSKEHFRAIRSMRKLGALSPIGLKGLNAADQYFNLIVDDDSGQISVSLKPKLPGGRFLERITIVGTLPDGGKLRDTVECRGFVRSDFIAHPPTAIITNTANQAGVNVRFGSKAGGRVNVENAEIVGLPKNSYRISKSGDSIAVSVNDSLFSVRNSTVVFAIRATLGEGESRGNLYNVPVVMQLDHQRL